MDMGRLLQRLITKSSKNLLVHLIQIFRGSGCKILVLYGQIRPQNPYFQIYMATILKFKILTPYAPTLTPTDCPCQILLRSLSSLKQKKGPRLPACVFSQIINTGCWQKAAGWPTGWVLETPLSMWE